MQPERFISLAEYLEMDRAADGSDGVQRYEYADGEVYAMAGASPEHIQIAFNVATCLSRLADPPRCRVAISEQRVQIGRRYAYPDVVY